MITNNFYKDKKVVVTGGSGFVGTHYIQELLSRGAIVKTHTHNKPLQIQDDRLEVLEDVNLKSLDYCNWLINGADYVIHSAGDIANPKKVPTDFQIALNQITLITNVLEASYRDNNVDTPLTKIARSAYQALSNKTSTGTPSQYFVQRFIDKVTITLYLTPGSSEAGKFLNYYYVKRIQDVGDYTNATDVPYRFVPCMVAGLAYYLAIKNAPQSVQMLKMLYEDELQRALAEDGSSSSTYISPKVYYPEA